MASPEVKSLIKFLQCNGGTVISGHTKFSVPPAILKEINRITQSIKEDIYVSKLTNSDLIKKYSNDNELMFLYDFVKKTPKLKISSILSSQAFSVDVGDFTNLKYLELYKFNVKCIKGLQLLRENLEIIVCSRCLEKVSDLLLNSEADNYVSCIWSKLRHVVLSCNSLVTLDESFIHTPWLQYLDISFNSLTDLRPLTCLMNLTHLDASYNHLKEVPSLTMSKLKVLVLNNNYIRNISGISKLKSLQNCDLSDNDISEHADLLPLYDLSLLISLNIARNPICYHPMHRSLTCGYLHENSANKHFLLDGHTLSSSEREFSRYCSIRTGNSFLFPSDSCSSLDDDGMFRVPKTGNFREPTIIDYESHGSDDFSDTESVCKSTPIKGPDDDEEHLDLKRKIEEMIDKHGEYWLPHARNRGLIGTATNASRNPSGLNYPLLSGGNCPDTPTNTLNEGVLDDRRVEENCASFEEKSEKEEEKESKPIEPVDESAISHESPNLSGSTPSEDSSDNEEDNTCDISEDSLWLVERIDGKSNGPYFLILNDIELKEIDPGSRKVVVRWGLDCVERYIKIQTDPFTIKLMFDVAKRDNCSRTYIMEYADAQNLINQMDKELNSRNFNQIVLRCVKCESLFCREKPRRKLSYIDDEEKVRCINCGSTHVLEEDESVLPPKISKENRSNKTEFKGNKVLQSPSLSSIGSAASLDQSSDTINNDSESRVSYQESDIEVISNPSESSIEVLAREPDRSSDNNKPVLMRPPEKVSISSLSAVDSRHTSAAIHQLLTESSSSGSMTDSSCTTIESNYHSSRGSRLISQSTVDEVLPEESSTETSPQQRRSEERGTPEEETISDDKKLKPEVNRKSMLDYVGILEGVFQTVTAKVMAATPPRRAETNGTVTPFEYSFTDFAFIDHRIKLFLWDQIIPDSEEMLAFVRVNAIYKSTIVGSPFSGFLIFTNKAAYLVKIVKEELDDFPGNWLQKYESVNAENIKWIQPIVCRQGFCIETDDRIASCGNVKYVILLNDEKRTSSFLSFVRDLGIVHVQKCDEFSGGTDSSSIFNIDQSIRNFTTSDSISIFKDSGENETHNFVGLIITNSHFIILKNDVDWLVPNSPVIPTVILKEEISNLVNVEESKNKVVLLFMDEIENTENTWYIKTVSADSNNRIISAIREPWEELFDVHLPVTPTAHND